MKLILVRHGHVEGITPPRFRGRTDLPLTSLGRRQAAATAARIAAEWKIDAIYASPASRAADTAAAIAEASGLAPNVLTEIADFDYGLWNGKSHDAVQHEWPGPYALWRDAPHLARPPGGETLQALALRTADALRLMLDRHDGQTVAMVAHDSVNRALLLQLLDLPLSAYWRLEQYPCCINEVDVSRKIIVRRINEHCHLLGLNEEMLSIL